MLCQVWEAWSEGQVEGRRLIPAVSSQLQLNKLKSDYSGGWSAHSHGHQLICSTFTTNNSQLYIGQADGNLAHYDALQPDFKEELNIEDGAVREVHIWTAEALLVVAGDTKIHFFQLGKLERVATENVMFVAEENRHISSFGAAISFCDHSDTTNILVSQRPGAGGRDRQGLVVLDTLVTLGLQSPPIQWKLWVDEVIVLQSNGVISIYKTDNYKTDHLQFQSSPNVMLMYKNPCYQFRDVIVCSTSTAAGLIVRTSYWLLGWSLHTNEGKLHRVLNQDKIQPEDEVWCLSLRRNLLLCGTESGCLILFSHNKTEAAGRQPCQDVHLKKGHSVIELDYDCYTAPAFKKQVSTRPILSVDIGFGSGSLLIYYRTDIQTISCLTLAIK